MSLRASLNSGLRLPPRAEKGEEVYSGVDAEQELSDPREELSRYVGELCLTAGCGCHRGRRRVRKFILEPMPSRSSAIP